MYMNTRNLLVALAFIVGFSTVAKAATVDEIIDKYLVALGGKDNLKKITALRMEGSITSGGNEVGVVATVLANKGARQDITVAGMTGYNIITPTEGWVYMPFSGQQKPEALTPDIIKQSQDGLDIQGELVDYKSKGHTVELMGTEDIEGTECYKLKVTLKNGKVKTDYIDGTSYFLIREVEKVVANGQEQEGTKNFSDFQKLPEGVVMPMAIGTDFGTVKIKKIVINPKLDDSIFKPDTK